jgi:hypothetical protein
MSYEEGGIPSSQDGPDRRRHLRFQLDAEITLWRPGKHRFPARIEELSLEGCRAVFFDRPVIGDRVLVKFKGLEVLTSTVCWVGDGVIGIHFDRSLHPAVFDLLMVRGRGS